MDKFYNKPNLKIKMKRESITWGLSTVIILLLLSIITLFLSVSSPCSSFFLCTEDVIFFIINLPGTILFLIVSFFGIFSVNPNNPPNDFILLIIKIIIIFVSMPLHFILGVLLRRLFKR